MSEKERVKKYLRQVLLLRNRSSKYLNEGKILKASKCERKALEYSLRAADVSGDYIFMQ